MRQLVSRTDLGLVPAARPCGQVSSYLNSNLRTPQVAALGRVDNAPAGERRQFFCQEMQHGTGQHTEYRMLQLSNLP
jgi:hypothetical protein